MYLSICIAFFVEIEGPQPQPISFLETLARTEAKSLKSSCNTYLLVFF